MHLLLTANHEDCDFETITVKRGQRVASKRTLAKELKMSEQEVKTALSHLKATNEITSTATRKYTVFTINNYDLYQTTTNRPTNDQPTINQQLTNDQPQCKNEKNEKNEKNDKNIDTSTENRTDYDEILSLYREICVSYPKVKALSDARKKAIRARLRTYSIDDFKTVFQNAENSSFLKGQNSRNWSATFDWMIRDANFAKILDGNYNGDNKPKATESEKADAYKSFIYNIDE